MAVIKYKDSNGEYQSLPYGAIGGATWGTLGGKPFTGIDSETLTVNDNGELTVIGGVGETTVTELTNDELNAVWNEIFEDNEE